MTRGATAGDTHHPRATGIDTRLDQYSVSWFRHVGRPLDGPKGGIAVALVGVRASRAYVVDSGRTAGDGRSQGFQPRIGQVLGEGRFLLSAGDERHKGCKYPAPGSDHHQATPSEAAIGQMATSRPGIGPLQKGGIGAVVQEVARSAVAALPQEDVLVCRICPTPTRLQERRANA